jgi:GNAT superfamily N-acetyltransferase
LHVDDAPINNRAAYNRFIVEFLEVHKAEWKPNEIVHWVAFDSDRVVTVISVTIVRKMPRPGDLRARWGYLSNVYALPEVRNQGVGGRLLTVIKSWATAENLELLVVWPSDQAYPSYERAGFSRHADPLVLKLARPS